MEIIIMKRIKDLCMNRIISAVICNVLLQALFINIYLFIININILNPIQWFKQWLSCILSVSTWIYFVPLSVVIVAQGIVCSRDYINLQPLYRTRFSFFIKMFSIHNQSVAILHILIGILIPWIYLSFSSEPTYNRFIYSCSNGFIDLDCFSEERMYLILSCVMVNVFYLLDNHFGGTKHLTFPIIQLPKLVQVKSQFMEVINDALPYAFVPNLLFMALYFCFGANLRHLITSTFSLYYSSLIPLDTFYGIFSFKRLFYMHFLTTVTVASMKFTEMLFKIHLTERHIFPITPTHFESQEILLKDALECEDYPIIQHLAYLDLVKLAESSSYRRAEIYKLSVPGGHPHVWNSLKNECLKVIDEFELELSSLLITKDKGKETFKDLHAQKLPHDKPAHKLIVTNSRNICQCIYDSFTECITEQVTWLNNLPVIIYFFAELKEMRVRYALRKSLLVMWSTQSLSFLTCYSLTEDSYGIVQNDVNHIITSLLNLKHVLDLLDKYFTTVYKIPKKLVSYQKSVALKNSVKGVYIE